MKKVLKIVEKSKKKIRGKKSWKKIEEKFKKKKLKNSWKSLKQKWTIANHAIKEKNEIFLKEKVEILLKKVRKNGNFFNWKKWKKIGDFFLKISGGKSWKKIGDFFFFLTLKQSCQSRQSH